MHHRISYQGHQGTLYINSNRVMFYGISFENICDAARLIRKLPAGVKYLGVCRVGVRGLRLPGNEIVADVSGELRWFVDENELEEYYLKKYNLSIV